MIFINVLSPLQIPLQGSRGVGIVMNQLVLF